jgi:hypothetical protein
MLTLGDSVTWSFILMFSTGYTHCNILVAWYYQHLQSDSCNSAEIIRMQLDLYCLLHYTVQGASHSSQYLMSSMFIQYSATINLSVQKNLANSYLLVFRLRNIGSNDSLLGSTHCFPSSFNVGRAPKSIQWE